MARLLSLIYGIIFLGIGIFGVLTGNHNHEMMSFGVNGAHHAVHILSGVLALAAYAGGEASSRGYLWFIGLTYGVVVVAGLLQIGPIVRLLNLNTNDNVLHLVLAGIAFFGIYKSKANAKAEVLTHV